MEQNEVLEILNQYDGKITTEGTELHYTKQNVGFDYQEVDTNENNEIYFRKYIRKVNIEFVFDFENDRFDGSESSYEILGGFGTSISTTSSEMLNRELNRFGFKRKNYEQLNLF